MAGVIIPGAVESMVYIETVDRSEAGGRRGWRHRQTCPEDHNDFFGVVVLWIGISSSDGCWCRSRERAPVDEFTA